MFRFDWSSFVSRTTRKFHRNGRSVVPRVLGLILFIPSGTSYGSMVGCWFVELQSGVHLKTCHIYIGFMRACRGRVCLEVVSRVAFVLLVSLHHYPPLMPVHFAGRRRCRRQGAWRRDGAAVNATASTRSEFFFFFFRVWCVCLCVSVFFCFFCSCKINNKATVEWWLSSRNCKSMKPCTPHLSVVGSFFCVCLFVCFCCWRCFTRPTYDAKTHTCCMHYDTIKEVHSK